MNPNVGKKIIYMPDGSSVEVPEGVRDAKDAAAYLAEQKARAAEKEQAERQAAEARKAEEADSMFVDRGERFIKLKDGSTIKAPDGVNDLQTYSEYLVEKHAREAEASAKKAEEPASGDTDKTETATENIDVLNPTQEDIDALVNEVNAEVDGETEQTSGTGEAGNGETEQTDTTSEASDEEINQRYEQEITQDEAEAARRERVGAKIGQYIAEYFPEHGSPSPEVIDGFYKRAALEVAEEDRRAQEAGQAAAENVPPVTGETDTATETGGEWTWGSETAQSGEGETAQTGEGEQVQTEHERQEAAREQSIFDHARGLVNVKFGASRLTEMWREQVVAEGIMSKRDARRMKKQALKDMKRAGLPKPSDEDLNTLFNRMVAEISRPRSR